MMLRGLAAAVVAALLLQSGTPRVLASETPDYLSFSTDDEANTTEVFQRASPAVVFVTSLGTAASASLSSTMAISFADSISRWAS